MESRLCLRMAVEITIRLSAVVFGSVPSLTAATVALSTLKNVPVHLNHDDDNEISVDDVSEDEDRPAVQLRDSIYTATGLTISVAVLGIILQLVFINIRFLLLGTNNFLAQSLCLFDIVISFILAAGHNVGRVFLEIATLPLKWIFFEVEFVDEDDPEKIRNTLTAGSAFSSNGTFLFVILAVFLIFILLKDQNQKEAVTSASEKN